MRAPQEKTAGFTAGGFQKNAAPLQSSHDADFHVNGSGLQGNSIAANDGPALRIKFTVSPLEGETKTERDQTWASLVQRACNPKQYARKKACPLVSFATYGDQRTENNSLKHGANLREYHAVCGDYDAELVPLAAAAQRLADAGVEAVLYTTARHTAAAPRWRVVCPLDAPATVEEHHALMELLNGLLGGVLARESFAVAQGFHFGAVAGVAYEARQVVGEPLDVSSAMWSVEPIPHHKAATVQPDEPTEPRDLPAFELVASALAAIPNDGAPDWLEYRDLIFAIHAGTGSSAEGRDLALAWSEQNSAHTAAEFADRWDRLRGIPAGGIGVGTLFHVASLHGWINPSHAVTSADDFEVLTGSGNASAPQRIKLLSRADLHNLPPLAWRVRGVLPATGIAALFGPSASGKSFLAFDMAAAVAAGREWFGCRVQLAPVVYAALEGEAGFKLRVEAWERHNERDLPERLHMVLQPIKLTDRQDVADLAAVVPAGAVVFIDTLNRAAPTADENTSRDMGEILEAAKRLQSAIAGLVVLVHHTGKDATRGLRGHSSLFAAMDAAIEVSRDGDRREWKVAKSKDGQDGDAHPFRLHVETIELDEFGDPLTSCVVVADPHLVHRAKPLNRQEREALDAFNGADTLHKDEWRTAFYASRTGVNPETNRRAFGRAVGALTALSLVVCEGDVCTRVDPDPFATHVA